MKALRDDLLSRLHVNEVDADELRYLLMTRIPGGVLHVGGQRDVLYGAGGENDFALRLQHDPATDAVVAVEPGPGLTPDLLDKLRESIEADLLNCVGDKIGRDVLLTESPIDGHFRYRDKFQIVPIPGDAPRAVWAPGKSARHPMVLEVSINASRNLAVNAFRKAKMTADVTLALNAFLRGSVRSSSGGGRFHWVIPQAKRGHGMRASLLMQEGYHARGIPPISFLSKFSSKSHFTMLGELKPDDYYALETWTPTAALMLPSNLSQQLDLHYGLKTEGRARWLRACYWFQHSNVVRAYSHSVAFAALVVCVDALIPENTVNHRKVQKFERFVSGLLKDVGISKETLVDFYNIRSQILHGNQLEHFDQDPLSVGLTPAMEESWRHFTEIRRVARLVLVKWLATRTDLVAEVSPV